MAQPPIPDTSDPVPTSFQGHFAEIIDGQDDVEGLGGTGKKKTKSKSGAARGPTGLTRSRGTGFETFYADPPVTPEEAREEAEELYPPDRPFVDRIEECIQRYRARRRLSTEMTNYFDRYLFLGGIDTSQRQFSGAGPRSKSNPDFENMDADDIRRATAVDMIHRGMNCRFYTEAETEHWEIDFTGVVAGFLSEAVPRLTSQNYAAMNTAVGVVENFLRYVLHHNVCPERGADVRGALALCQKARVDLPKAHHALVRFPGEFGLAAAELFCKDYVFLPRETIGGFKRAEDFNARVIFATGILLAGKDKQIKQLIDADEELNSIQIIKEKDRDLEVVSTHGPLPEIRRAYKSLRLGHSRSAMQPLGTVVFKPCLIEDGYDVGEIAAARPLDETEQDFLLDDQILYFLQPGMKVRATVCELDSGIAFIKSVADVLVPWFVFLPQTLMFRFREPRLNDRPAPSAAGAAEAEDDYEID
ncbi:hypothetical protein ACHAQH_006237 [Verticillium albo-atrum]